MESSDVICGMSWQAVSVYSNNIANLIQLLCPNPKEDNLRELKIDMNEVRQNYVTTTGYCDLLRAKEDDPRKLHIEMNNKVTIHKICLEYW